MTGAAPTATVACPGCGRRNRVPVAARGVARCAVCRRPLPWIVDADAATFDAALDATVPVLVDFWADWCGPCHMVAPLLARAAVDYAGRLKVVKLDTEAAPQIALRYGVRSIPLLVLSDDGRELDRLVGAVPERHLRQWLDERLPAGDRSQSTTARSEERHG